jgi:spindle assembly abnormal protein 6
MELFRKDIPLLLKLNEREQKEQKITVTVHLKESTSPLHSKELVIRLTDDSDPFFLYSLALSEDDYSGLKSQQGLLVDYAAFPQKFIDLLNLCLSESTSSTPRFLLQLVTFTADKSSALLNVVEANPFKHLTHLSLKVLLASDSVLKKYLAECLMSLREEKSVLSETLTTVRADLSSQLNRAQELLAERTAEVEQRKAEWSTQNTTLSSKYAREVEAERERAIQTQSEAAKKFEAEKQSLIGNYEAKLLQLETKAQSLESHNRVLSETRYKLEASVSELKSKLQVADDELSSVRQEVVKARQESHSLDSAVHELERSIQQLTTRVAVQEQELKDKEEVISRTNQLLNTASEQKLKSEATVERQQKQIMKLDTAYKTASQEVLKGNEIIQKLQNEKMRVQGKLKMKNVAVMQQEKLLEEKEASVAHHKKEIESLSQSIVIKREEVSVTCVCWLCGLPVLLCSFKQHSPCN